MGEEDDAALARSLSRGGRPRRNAAAIASVIGWGEGEVAEDSSSSGNEFEAGDVAKPSRSRGRGSASEGKKKQRSDGVNSSGDPNAQEERMEEEVSRSERRSRKVKVQSDSESDFVAEEGSESSESDISGSDFGEEEEEEKPKRGRKPSAAKNSPKKVGRVGRGRAASTKTSHPVITKTAVPRRSAVGEAGRSPAIVKPRRGSSLSTPIRAAGTGPRIVGLSRRAHVKPLHPHAAVPGTAKTRK